VKLDFCVTPKNLFFFMKRKIIVVFENFAINVFRGAKALLLKTIKIPTPVEIATSATLKIALKK
jgi:hypothetical protein